MNPSYNLLVIWIVPGKGFGAYLHEHDGNSEAYTEIMPMCLTDR
jgi:hypothetical protein